MKTFLARFKKISPVVIGVMVLGLLVPGVSFAAGGTASLVGSKALQGLAEISAVVINIFTFLTLLLLNFGGELLGTDLITGAEAMNAIHPMWVWVRNLVNVLFVGILVYLAFANLFSSFKGDSGNWTIKDKLPKIILSLVAINFSLMAFRLIIDAVNVGTVAILGIADTKLEGTDYSALNSIVDKKTWMRADNEEKKTELENIKPQLDPGDIPGGGAIDAGMDCSDVRDDLLGKTIKKTGITKTIPAKIVVKDGEDLFVCESALDQINDTFCPKWRNYSGKKDFDSQASEHDCLFMLNPKHYSKNGVSNTLSPHSKPGRNLFMAFGTVFMHLERLPALGAKLGSLSSVLDNTLFSALMSIAYLVALVAIFVALIGRLIVLWIGLVFSPVLVAASIMGFGGASSESTLGKKLITNLIMPIKIAAAFAVSFVMLSAMVTFTSTEASASEQAFWFGPALSQMGQGEYSLLWQLATIVVFWMAAFWAIEGNLAEKLTNGIKSGIEELGKTTAAAATIYRPIFAVGTGKEKYSVGSLMKMPSTMANQMKREQESERMKLGQKLGILPPGSDKTQTLIRNIDYLGENAFLGQVLEKLFASTASVVGTKEMYQYLKEHNATKEYLEDNNVSESDFISNTQTVLQEMARASKNQSTVDKYSNATFGGEKSSETKTGKKENISQQSESQNGTIKKTTNKSGETVVEYTTENGNKYEYKTFEDAAAATTGILAMSTPDFNEMARLFGQAVNAEEVTSDKEDGRVVGENVTAAGQRSDSHFFNLRFQGDQTSSVSVNLTGIDTIKDVDAKRSALNQRMAAVPGGAAQNITPGMQDALMDASGFTSSEKSATEFSGGQFHEKSKEPVTGTSGSEEAGE